MRIKKFEQLNENLSQDKMKEIYDEFMGYVNAEENEEIDFEYTNGELFDFAGEISLKHHMDMTDIKDFISHYPNDWHIETFFGDLINQDNKIKETEQKQIDIIKEELGKVGVEVTDEVIGAVNNIMFRINDELEGYY